MAEVSSMDESTTSSTTETISIHHHHQQKLPTTFLSTPKSSSPPQSTGLYRMGSNTSVILDTDNNGIEAESRKLPSSKYKGVVPQPNGRWGAQIYEKHQRVWLGTFNEENDAAKAYDIAAQRFRGRDAVTNFKPLSDSDHERIEIEFLNSHSKSEIVDMLRKHTYHDELEQSKKNFKLINAAGGGGGGNNTTGTNNYTSCGDRLCFGRVDNKADREHLFEKVVTPSDVGKLNRLVIPKQHAEKHFPLQGGSNLKGVLLNFEDGNDKVWRFRYSYWNSSQSYVLTKGWSRFVKEKNLKAGDVVSFYKSTGVEKQLFIDWRPAAAAKNLNNNKNNVNTGLVVSPQPVVEQVRSSTPANIVAPVFRLFGVNICSGSNGEMVAEKVGNGGGPAAAAASGGGGGNKRISEMELFSLESSCKKQMVVGAL